MTVDSLQIMLNLVECVPLSAFRDGYSAGSRLSTVDLQVFTQFVLNLR